METQTLIRLTLGLLMTAVVLAFAVKRVLWLTKLIRSGQPTSDERGRKDHLATRIRTQMKEVFGQTRLLRWSIPGLAHFFTMWGFFILGSGLPGGLRGAVQPDVRHPDHRPLGRAGLPAGLLRARRVARHHHFRHHPADARAQGARPRVPVLRLPHRRRLADPVHDLQRHLDLRAVPRRRGGQRQPALRLGRFFSHGMGATLQPLGHTANEIIETVALLLHIGVMLVFLLIVLHSKHLHIFLAPINVMFKRLPERASARCCRWSTRASRSTSKIPPRTRYSAAARSRTSPGRATSTSPPVPSAAAASRSARRGTPESRSRPSSSS